MRAFSAATMGLALALATVAHAQDGLDENEARARIHFESGRTYFEDGAYERAAEAFESAYALSHHPELLMNIASSYERLGRSAEAADFMERYLADADPAEVDNRDALERRIANLRSRADGTGASNESEQQSTDARTLGAIISFATAGVGLATFGALGGLALAERSSLESGCGATRSCLDADVGGLRDLSLGADIGLIIAGAGAIAGVIVLLLVDGGDAGGEAPVASITPWVAPESAGVAYGGRL